MASVVSSIDDRVWGIWNPGHTYRELSRMP